ncbi:deoxynucleoside kinase-like isoform X1 [Macrobrachium rosenbergii]|uniref:deoxynucleoside kinase-like isoform X1 n=2 Tax=Macrobrachium rosenbergii TaxID=79674 RepID=UPI0034D5D0E8
MMCSKILTESPVKNPPLEEPVIDLQKGCNLLDPAVKNLLGRSPSSSPLKNGVEGPSGMSLLPASLLLQRSFNLMASKASSEGKRKSRPFTVSIEGNIGSGKSTFLHHFSALPGVATYQEPLGLWTNLKGHNLLGKLYEDPQRWSFLFQSYVQLTRLDIHLQDTNCPVKLIERSLQNNRYCFVESGYDCGHLQGVEYSVLCEYFDLLESQLDIGIDLIVYLRSTPEVVHDRMLRRGRSEEAGVPLEYLKQVHEYYERWLLQHKPRSPPAPVLVIDADKDLNEVVKEYEEKKSFIMGEKPIKYSVSEER